jgi:DNA-binding transcriptional LysR family regulator
MHIESFEVFRTAVEYGSVTKASQVLHMTQSTASRHLQSLEDEYGGLLFERSAAGLRLTALGEALYPFSCDILACAAQAKQELLRIRQEGGGMAVGATLSIGETVLPKILGVVRRQYPQAEIRMRISNTSDVLEDLARHRIDVALIEGMVDSTVDFQVTPWRDDELILLASPQHEFAGRPFITLSEMLSQPLLIREEGSGTRQVTQHALEEHDLLSHVTITMELGSNQAIKSAIAAGLGLAFLSRLTVAEECRQGQLVHIPVQGFQIHRKLSIVERPERYPKYLVKSLLQVLFSTEV